MLLAPHHLGLTAVFSHHHGWTAKGYIGNGHSLSYSTSTVAPCLSLSSLSLTISFSSSCSFFYVFADTQMSGKHTLWFLTLNSNYYFFFSYSINTSLLGLWDVLCGSFVSCTISSFKKKRRKRLNQNHIKNPLVPHCWVHLFSQKLSPPLSSLMFHFVSNAFHTLQTNTASLKGGNNK